MKSFTLIEILLTLMIIAFIVLILVFLTLNISNFNTYFIFNIGKNREIITTATIMAKELRTIMQSNTGNYPLEKILNNEIIFYADIDGDNLIEKIRYFVNNKTLKKGIIKPNGNPLNYDPSNELIFDMVTNLVNNNIFSYYNRDNQEEYTINEIKIIKVNISAQEPRGIIINHSFVVAPRNLRFK